MPIVFIEAPPGIRVDAKKKLVQEVCAALDVAYRVPDTRIFLREWPLDGDPIEQAARTFRADDAEQVRQLLDRHPEIKAKVNEPIGPFDTPVITGVRSRAMLDVLLDAGADINAKSRWWAGGFGIVHSASPELVAYAIERGAVVDAHAAARLGLFDTLKQLVARDPNVVHEPTALSA